MNRVLGLFKGLSHLRAHGLASLIIIILTASLKTVTNAAPTTFYVAPNGNNNNPGSLSQPWQTIAHAASSSQVKPGDTVYIRAGVYNEYIQQNISGSSSAPITYENYPGEKPIITGTGSWRWHILEQSYITIKGLTFQNFGDGGIQIRTRKDSITNVKILNCTFENQFPVDENGAKTIHVTTAGTSFNLDNIVIANNNFFNVDSGPHPSIQVAGNAQKVSIVNNVVAGTSSIVIGIAGRTDIGQPDNILIKGNHILNHGFLDIANENNNSPGIYLDAAGNNIVIENNVIHDGVRGIMLSAEPVASSLVTQHAIVRWNVLYNNTEMNIKLGVGNSTANCAHSGELKYGAVVHNTLHSESGAPTNIHLACGEYLRVKNNILTHTSPQTAFHYRFANGTVNPATWQLNHNLFHSTGATKTFQWGSTLYTSLSSYQTAVSQDQNSLTGNPLFADIGQDDFTLNGDSTARDAGGWLTQTNGSGSGKVIPVNEAWYFSDGLGLQDGDLIHVGSNDPVRIVNVDYANNLVTVDQSIAWQDQNSVSYVFKGNAPDIGAFEFEPQLELRGSPADGAIHLNWEINDELPTTAVFKIDYTGPQGNPPSPINAIAPDIRQYTLTNLKNYEFYVVNLTVLDNGTVLLSDSVTVMPTDIFSFLPIVTKNG